MTHFLFSVLILARLMNDDVIDSDSFITRSKTKQKIHFSHLEDLDSMGNKNNLT